MLPALTKQYSIKRSPCFFVTNSHFFYYSMVVYYMDYYHLPLIFHTSLKFWLSWHKPFKCWKCSTYLVQPLRALLLDDKNKLCLALWETAQLFPQWHNILHSRLAANSSLVLCPHQHENCQLVQLGACFNRCLVASSFKFAVPNDIRCPASFHMPVCHLQDLLRWGFLLIFLSLLIGWSAFLVLSFRSSLCILESPSPFLKDVFLFMIECMYNMSVQVHLETKRMCQITGAEVTDSCEPLKMSAGNWTLVLQRNSSHKLLTNKPFLQLYRVKVLYQMGFQIFFPSLWLFSFSSLFFQRTDFVRFSDV